MNTLRELRVAGGLFGTFAVAVIASLFSACAPIGSDQPAAPVGMANTAALVPSFGKEIFPYIEDNCTYCHKPGTQGNAGVFLENYEQIRTYAKDGLLMSSILEPNPEIKMPPVSRGLDPVPPEMIERLRLWIEAGTPDN